MSGHESSVRWTLKKLTLNWMLKRKASLQNFLCRSKLIFHGDLNQAFYQMISRLSKGRWHKHTKRNCRRRRQNWNEQILKPTSGKWVTFNYGFVRINYSKNDLALIRSSNALDSSDGVHARTTNNPSCCDAKYQVWRPSVPPRLRNLRWYDQLERFSNGLLLLREAREFPDAQFVPAWCCYEH